MAGSFDSHFARHNMMWQCQLSQPDCRCYRVDGYSLLKRLPLHPLIGPRCPLQSVGQWLDSIGLVQYENHLLANGFDNVQFLVSVLFETRVCVRRVWEAGGVLMLRARDGRRGGISSIFPSLCCGCGVCLFPPALYTVLFLSLCPTFPFSSLFISARCASHHLPFFSLSYSVPHFLTY